MPVDARDALELFIDRLLLRSSLTDEEQDALRGLPARAENFPAGAEIVAPGQVTTHACLVARGLAGRFDRMLDGGQQTVALYVPGDMCDLHSVPVKIAGWGIETLANATLVFVPKVALAELATHHPAIAFALWRDTVADSSVLAKWIANLGRRQAAPRVAHLFCEMALRMKLAGLGNLNRFALPTSQSRLADVLGLTPIHLNRTLMALRAQGVIFRGGIVWMENWEDLADFAEFDPTYLLISEPVLSED